MAYLELKDPSKVKKIESFTSELDVKKVDLSAETDLLRDILAGYPGDANAVVAAASAGVETLQDATTLFCQLDTFNDRFGLASIPDELLAVLEGHTALPGKEHGEIVLAADAIIRNSKIPLFDSRVQELRAHLL